MKHSWLAQFLDQTDKFLTKLYMPLIAVGIVVCALLVRKPLISFESQDYTYFLSGWYDFIKAHGGVGALQYNFSDYSPSYLYLLVLATILPIKKLLAIKAISITFDFFLAFVVYLLVDDKYRNKRIAFAVAASILFLPTVLLNSAMWGQSDSIYGSFCLLSLYFMTKKKGILSCIAAGIALSLKLQTVFFLPVLIVGVIKKEIHPLKLLFIPLFYVISLIPAALAGRPFSNMLLIYFQQTQEFTQRLSWNAPNLYLWIPDSFANSFKSTGVYFTLGLLLLCFFLILQFTGKLTKEMTIKVSLLFVLLIPFFLPQMHERYFYLAEIISIVYAVYFPKYLYIPLLVQIPAVCTYLSYLMGVSPLPGQYLPFFHIVTISIVLFDFVKQLQSQPVIVDKLDPSITQPLQSEDLAVKI